MFQHVMIGMKAIRRATLKKWKVRHSIAPSITWSLDRSVAWSFDRWMVRTCLGCVMHFTFAFEFRNQVRSSKGCAVTTTHIVKECNSLYNVHPKSTKNGLPKRLKWGPGGVKKLSEQPSGAQYVIMVTWTKNSCPFLDSFGAPKRVPKRIDNHVKKKNTPSASKRNPKKSQIWVQNQSQKQSRRERMTAPLQLLRFERRP